jgi:putative transposase
MTTTFAAALRHDEITVPCVFDGPISRSGLAARRFVVLDNLASHKVKGVRQLIEEAGALRYLPAYSPDLNPIEQACASYHVAFPRHRRRPVINGFTHTLGRVVSRPAPDARSLSAIASVAQPSYSMARPLKSRGTTDCQSKERGTSPVNSPAEVAQVVALACVVNCWRRDNACRPYGAWPRRSIRKFASSLPQQALHRLSPAWYSAGSMTKAGGFFARGERPASV